MNRQIEEEVQDELFTKDSMDLGRHTLDSMEGAYEALAEAMDKGAKLRDFVEQAAGQLDKEGRDTDDVLLIRLQNMWQELVARVVELAKEYNKRSHDQFPAEATISISQKDWKLLLRCAWCSALDSRDVSLALLLVRNQLKEPEGRLTRISLLNTADMVLMLKEIETERAKIEQRAKPAFHPLQKEILETVETMIRSEISRRKEEEAR